MDQQQIDVLRIQRLEARFDRFSQGTGAKMIALDLRGHEDRVARNSRTPQSLADRRFIAIDRRRVDVAISDRYRLGNDARTFLREQQPRTKTDRGKVEPGHAWCDRVGSVHSAPNFPLNTRSASAFRSLGISLSFRCSGKLAPSPSLPIAATALMVKLVGTASTSLSFSPLKPAMPWVCQPDRLA